MFSVFGCRHCSRRILLVLFVTLYSQLLSCESENGGTFTPQNPTDSSIPSFGDSSGAMIRPPENTLDSSGLNNDSGTPSQNVDGMVIRIDGGGGTWTTGEESGAGIQNDATSPTVDSATGQQDGTVGSLSVDSAASAEALRQLNDYLALPLGSRGDILSQPFAQSPLTRSDAEAACAALWADLAEELGVSRRAEQDAKSITIGGYTLRYETVVLGSEPPTGRSLFISMHGGGDAAPSDNDKQWRNQIALATNYNPQEALWVAPRAPTDDWNMWFKDHIDGLFDRLITNMIVFEGIDPNKVYLTGYSAGGDGVYGLTPRTADYWAGVAMSAGHPNGISLANVRNLAFALYVGANDTAFDRNKVGMEYAAKLDALEAADPGGYPHQSGFPPTDHWMNLADQASIPFIQSYTRNPVPDRVIWEQHSVTHSRFYWLAVDAANEREGTKVVTSYKGQTITIEEVEGLSSLIVRFSDVMLDMDQPVTIVRAGNTLFEGHVQRTISTIAKTLLEREDPEMVYLGEVAVSPMP